MRAGLRRVFLLVAMALTMLLGACKPIQLPQYWLCEGRSSQLVTGPELSQGRFQGSDPVLLELFDNQVYQFFSPALAGAFVQCPPDKPNTLLFQMGNCQVQAHQDYYRQGNLNLQTGQLSFFERRKGNGFVAEGEAQYQCKFIGNTYSFAPFNDVKKSQ